ncbi:class I tRNA ligase family protein [bacterium]|nr:class I tRNA ligase family protein [bacterium]
MHIAPAFGEDDWLGAARNIPGPNPWITPDVSEVKWRIRRPDGARRQSAHHHKHLKERGMLVRQETVDHNYPHCWRDDSPLIYRSISTWFLNVEKIKASMLAANQKINWIPAHIRDGRFGKWLENAHDWNISRTRYWGAPIPVWRCDKTGEIYVPSSLEDLSRRWGRSITDLHRPAIDEVVFPSPGAGTSGACRTCWTAGSSPGPCRTRRCIIRSRTRSGSRRTFRRTLLWSTSRRRGDGFIPWSYWRRRCSTSRRSRTASVTAWYSPRTGGR